MANSRASSANYEYATVDEAPDENGYFTNDVDVRSLWKVSRVSKLFFSMREAEADISAAPSALSTATVVLQFRCPGDAGWTDFVPLDGSALAIGNRIALEDMGAGVLWRAGVVSDGYTSGSVRFGFDW